MKMLVGAAAALALVALPACFQPDPDLLPPEPPEYAADVGEAQWQTIRDEVPRVLMRQAFTLLDRTDPPAPRFRTAWRARSPFPDEREAGADTARTQVIVRGIPVRDSDRFLVTLTVLNEVQFDSLPGWREMAATPTFTEYAAGIARSLALGIEGG